MMASLLALFAAYLWYTLYPLDEDWRVAGCDCACCEGAGQFHVYSGGATPRSPRRRALTCDAGFS